MATLAKLVVKLEAESSRLTSELEKANKRAARWENKTKRSISGVKKAFIGLGVAVAAVKFTGFIRDSLNAANKLAKVSDKLGITTEKLSGLRYAAELSGIASNTLDMAIQRMTRRLSEAAKGTGEARDAIKELGFDAQKLASMSPDQAFIKISKAMEKVTAQGDRVRLSFKLFDSEGVALVNMLNMGEEGLRAVSAEAEALGIAISRVEAAKIERANDAMTRAGSVATGLGNAIAVNVAPFVEALSTHFANAAIEAGGMSNFVATAMDKVVGAVGFAADSVRGLQVVWKGLQVIALGAISGIITELDELNKAGADALGWLPGIEIKPSSALSEWAEESRLALMSTMDEMERLVNAPMPSSNIKQWSNDIQYQAQVAAEAIAKTKQAMIGGDTGGVSPVAAKQSGLLAKSIDALQQSLLTEEQRIAESYDRRSFMVEEAFQNQIISEQYKNELIENLEKQHQDKLVAMAVDAERKKRSVMAAGLGAAANIFSGISALMSREGKKQSIAQKRMAQIGIGLSTAQAVMLALHATPFYLVNVGLAAGAALQGAKQLQMLNNAGGGVSPISTSSPAVASPRFQETQSQPIEAQQNTQPTFIIVGDSDYSESRLDDLLERVGVMINEGSRVFIRRDSPQAQEIALAAGN